MLRGVDRGPVDARVLLRVLHDPSAPDVLQIHDVRELLAVDAVLVVDEPAGVAEGDGLRPEVEELLHRVLRHVAGTRDETGLVLERLVARLQHLLGEVDGAVAGRLGPDQRAAPVEALAGEDAGELVPDPLVLTEQVADLPSADADVAGRHVGELPDVPLELGHEGLAEPHHLALGLALRVEVGAALARTHRERGQRVLEDLLEREELQQTEIDRRMEAKATLVRADRAAHLDPEPSVDLDVAPIVDPRNPEHHDALRFDRPLEDLRIDVAGVPGEGQLDRFGDLLDRLVELGLAGVLGDELRHQPVHVVTHGNSYLR